MLAGRHALELKLDQDAGLGLHQVGVAHCLAAAILELRVGRFPPTPALAKAAASNAAAAAVPISFRIRMVFLRGGPPRQQTTPSIQFHGERLATAIAGSSRALHAALGRRGSSRGVAGRRAGGGAPCGARPRARAPARRRRSAPPVGAAAAVGRVGGAPLSSCARLAGWPCRARVGPRGGRGASRRSSGAARAAAAAPGLRSGLAGLALARLVAGSSSQAFTARRAALNSRPFAQSDILRLFKCPRCGA